MLNNTELYFPVTTSSSAAVDYYVSAPYKCTVRDMIVTAQADPGDADTVTVLDGTTAVGVCTFGSDLTAPCNAGAYVPDTTNGKNVFAKGDMIKIQVSQCAAAVGLGIHLMLDPYARTT